MSELSGPDSIALILPYCMALEHDRDEGHAWQVAEICGLIRDGKPTQDGCVLATLMHSNKEVSYSKVKQITAPSDA